MSSFFSELIRIAAKLVGKPTELRQLVGYCDECGGETLLQDTSTRRVHCPQCST